MLQADSKLTIGLLLQIVRMIVLMTLDVLFRQIHFDTYGYNVTLGCVFQYYNYGDWNTSFSIKWLVIPYLVHLVSLLFFLLGIIEFISSQSPYSMKGLMFGAQFTLICGCLLPMFVTFEIFKHRDSFTNYWGTKVMSCGFWYSLTAIVVDILAFFGLLCLLKRYKMRKREDLLPNEHIFAERFYSQEI